MLKIQDMDISNLNAVMTTLSSYVTINNSTGITISNLSPSQQQEYLYLILLLVSSTPIGTLAEVPFDITDGVYSHNTIFYKTIGIVDEDYESGEIFSQYSWVQGNYPWFITNNNQF